MKKMALGFLFCASTLTQVGADPRSMIYHSLPPSCRIVLLGKQAVIQDTRGFFVGYYVPLPPPAPAWVPTPKKVNPAPSSNSYFGGGYDDGYSNYDSGYYDSPCSSHDDNCSSGFSSSQGSSYSDPGGSPLCSPDYGFGR